MHRLQPGSNVAIVRGGLAVGSGL